MKRYRYIGTEEQLVERGFVKDTVNSDENWVWYDKDCLDDRQESDDILIVNFIGGGYGTLRILQFNYSDRPYETITPYIQDLINDGLVEVIEE